MTDKQHFSRLVRVFAAAPSSIYETDDLHVASGRARLQIQIETDDADANGAIDRSLFYKLLCDAASLAANSLVEDRLVIAESFNLYIFEPFVQGEVTAAARVVSAHGTVYGVEALLVDEDGRKLAVGNGIFSRGAVDLDEPTDAPDLFDLSSEDEDDDASEGEGRAYGAMFKTPYGWMHLN